MKSVVTFAGDHADLASANRRTFLMQAATSVGLLAAGMVLDAATPVQAKSQPAKGASSAFWPDGIKLVISISMQFEAGGQPPKGADSPFPGIDFPPSVPSDAAANTWFAYGYREGIPRMLDLWDRHGVKVTCHMIGEAAQRHPEAGRRRRMMAVSARRPGVAFRRKDEITRFVLQSPLTLRESETI